MVENKSIFEDLFVTRKETLVRTDGKPDPSCCMMPVGVRVRMTMTVRTR